jgi:sugar/nucleoside kinase (ribokinase family)
VADVVVRRVDRLPEPGELIVVDDLRLVSGGCAANTAAVIAKLGTRRRLVGLVGKDSMGAAAVADQKACGVDTEFIGIHESKPTSSVIVVVSSDGERSFLYKEGSSETLTLGSVLPALEGANHVHLAGTMKLGALDMASVLRHAKQAGATTSADTDWDPDGIWMDKIAAFLPYCDVLTTSLSEGLHLTGQSDPADIGQCLLKLGPELVVVKCGRDGAYGYTSGGALHCPAFEVDAVDTTCAGDSFVAGFIHARISGHDTLGSVRFGCACGSLSTTEVSHCGVVSSQKPTLMAFQSYSSA